MLNVYLLRHGETWYDAYDDRYCGRTDIGLSEKGWQQASLVNLQLKGVSFDKIYSSPLKRAKYTAEIASGSKMIITDKRLVEVDFGDWEGKTKAEFIAENPELWYNWVTDPAVSKAGGTGENATDVLTRLHGFYREILEKHSAGNILVVGHNGVNRLYLAYKLGMSLNQYKYIVQENSFITLFSLGEGGELRLLNSGI